ncbi:dimethylarginine dimethylaminohydrolase family protein [Clostridium sp.]|uniref:dimethylarginine dimethylaminohydrolase family protein n=1 Tax=Clostridium sp. TaxID=1506 RepID=UPI0026DAA517|nr:arginine deiminase family protein [Clostridium sp.]MDO5038790.1 arginine deiminase family protein [Clostridium sp.]
MREIDYILMRYPSFIDIDKNNRYRNNFSKERALDNYNNLLNILTEENIKFKFLNTERCISELFTRDLGFSLGNIMFICNLRNASRKSETKKLVNYIERNRTNYYIFENNIEGGDIIICGNTVFVGISQRTTEAAVYELRDYVEEKNLKYEIVPIRFDSENNLHLDCVFNSIDRKSAVVSDYVYDIDEIKSRIKNLYYISKESVDNLGPNFVVLDKKRIIATDIEVTRILRKAGYKVIFCEYDEIVKLGGSVCCSTLPMRL